MCLFKLLKQTSGTRKTRDCCAGRGRGERGVPGAQPHDPAGALPPRHPHVGLHVLLLGAGPQPRRHRRAPRQGAGLPPARRPPHPPHQHPGLSQVRLQGPTRALSC